MIQVRANLPRGPVYLAGETIVCEVYFSNNCKKEKHGDKADMLAWSSVQIICQCTVSDSFVQLLKPSVMTTEEASSTGCDTSFVANKGERGLTVFCSKPKILFCDLKLQPSASKSFTFEDTIPSDTPPSFRGQAVKYSFKVIIGMQRPGARTELIRIPFRVMVMPGLNDMSVYNEAEESKPKNPFCDQRKEHSVLDVALQVMATVTGRKVPHSYNITNSKGRVAKVVLFKQAYKLGEDIVGLFDFSGSSVPCVQFSVTLQSEEHISEECRQKVCSGTMITSYIKHEEMCLNVLQTHVNLPIPLSATPTFMTDIVCQRWRLHFEFVTSLQPCPGPATCPHRSENVGHWQGPATLDVETMVWNLPIRVFPTNPLNTSAVTFMKTTVTANI